MMGFFVLDGTASKDFGVSISGSGSWPTPEREVEKVKIPGRNGYLITYVGKWENVDIEYPAFIARGFSQKWDRFAEWWNTHTDNYYHLTDTYHTEYYRMARPIGRINPDVGTLNLSAKFDLKFDCKPQKFLRDGEVARVLRSGNTITLKNPTAYEACPLIVSKMDGQADSVIMIADSLDNVISELRFKTNDGNISYGGAEIIYDADTQEATSQIQANLFDANAAVVESFENEFKKFSIPPNEAVSLISWHGDFDIYPRWFRI